jgi:hypothetical protein
MLVSRYKICVEKRGDDGDKSYTLNLSQFGVKEIINKFTLLFDCAWYVLFSHVLWQNWMSKHTVASLSKHDTHTSKYVVTFPPYGKYGWANIQ